LPAVPARFRQLAAELLMVVDLAIVGNPERFVLIRHRLRRRIRKIDDRQPAVSEAYAAVGRHPVSRAVRTAMDHCVAHSRDVRARHAVCAVREDQRAVDAAHCVYWRLARAAGAPYCWPGAASSLRPGPHPRPLSPSPALRLGLKAVLSRTWLTPKYPA